MKRLLLLLALMVGAAAPALAQEDVLPKVKTRLIAEGAAPPGGSVTVALEQDIRTGWHTYWRNPGQAGGLPTSIDWSLPPGWTAGDIQWPVPKRLPIAALKQVDYGYENRAWLLTDIHAPA